MNKNELVEAVAKKAGQTKVDATKSIDAVIDAVKEALASGDDVRLIGFGTFSVSTRAAYTGRNPSTGEEIHIKSSKQPKFKAGKALKDAVN